MAQRGRKSAASNVVSIAANSRKPTIIPSRSLSKSEKQIFNVIIEGHHHLRSMDAPLLTTYVAACAKMLVTKDIADFEKLVRVALACATKLRLTPQAVLQPRSLGRKYADAAESSGLWRKPWDRVPDSPDDADESNQESNNQVWTEDMKRKWPNNPENPDNRRKNK